MSQPCPPPERWKAHLDGTLPDAEQAVLTEHLDRCADCRKTLETLAGGGDSLLDVARQSGNAADAPAPALHDVLEQWQVPPTETQAGPAGAGGISLSFLAPSDKPGHLGRLGHYEVQEVIGQGGFGIVLKAFDEKLHRVVAIKVLAPAYAASGPARKRFIREARAAAAVKNEHVVAIYNVQDDEQPPYLVMELIDGISLQDKLDKQGPLSVKEILRIGLQTAEGLAAAHKQGLVHRDIKPANILLENGVERVKITDFGLARAVDDASVTQSGTVAGTPLYMSPEQAGGLALDHRSDLFSLGTVLYVMCTGRPPFRASGTMAVLKRVIEDAPRPIPEINEDVPRWLCDIIAKLHAKKPGERFQSANEVADVLAKYLADVQAHGLARDVPPGETAPAAAPGSRPGPKSSRGRRRRTAVVAVVILAGVFVWFAPWLSRYWRNVGYFRISGEGAADVELVLSRNGQVVQEIRGLGYQGFRLPPGDYELQAKYDKTRWGCYFQQSWRYLLGRGSAARKTDRLNFSVSRGDEVIFKVNMIALQSPNNKDEPGKNETTPPPAVAPFDAARAKAHQEAWAKHLGVDVEITNAVGMKLRLIPPGEFKMGTSREEIARLKKEIAEADDRSPVLDAVEREAAAHRVRLTRPFYLGVHEVTVAQFRRFVEASGYKTEAERDGKGGKILHPETGAYTPDPKASWRNPFHYAVKDDYPVVQVSWNDAQAFCRWLSQKEGRTYRLPTEAEWEFACRAGSAGRFSFGEDPFEQGHYTVFNQPTPQRVGSKRPNRFGLFDMEGNVSEWCGDWYGGLYSGTAETDPQGPPMARTASPGEGVTTTPPGAAVARRARSIRRTTGSTTPAFASRSAAIGAAGPLFSGLDSTRATRYLHRRYEEILMKTRVQKWGNSLALRIPKAFAAEARLNENTAVELSLVDGKLVIQPLAPGSPTLDELLKGVTDENLHGEWDTGPAVGKEVW